MKKGAVFGPLCRGTMCIAR